MQGRVADVPCSMAIEPGPLPLPVLREVPVVLPETARDMGNPPWEEARARILIVRLSAWSDVDISNPHTVLFAETRAALPDAYIDFAFLPQAADRAALDRAAQGCAGIPWFFGRASSQPPAEFDLVMVSNAFALELVNLPHMLAGSGLPVRASARRAMDRCPIVILGGSNASCAGSLVQRDAGPGAPATESIPDGIFFGEGEGAIGELARILAGPAPDGSNADSGAADRADRLRAAAAVQGFWPCMETPGARRRVPGPAVTPLLRYPVLNGESADTARLSITAGCPGFCSFCLEGWDRRPYRELPLARALDAARELKRASGAENLDIYSFNFNTHEQVDELVFELNRIFDRVSFMSQRLDILARSPGLAALEMAGGKKSFTLGIEGISARMRAYYRKGLTGEDLEACLDTLVLPGVKEIKLFYIISGFETADDIGEFARFAAGLADLRQARSPGLRVIASAGFLVRLPFTPLQYAPLALDESALKDISAALRGACEPKGIEYREAADFGEYYVDQMLALDTGTLLPWLEALAGGAHVYETSLPRAIVASLRSFRARHGLSDQALAREKDASWRPPLEFMEDDSRHAVLRAHYEAARAEVDRPGCLGSSCSDCGACDDGAGRVRMVRHRGPHASPYALVERTSKLLGAKAKFAWHAVDIELPESIARATDAYRSAWLLRVLFRAWPESVKFVFSARELLFARDRPFAAALGARTGRWGRTRFALRGPDAALLAQAAARLADFGATGTTAAGFGAGSLPAEPRWADLEFAGDDARATAGRLGAWLDAAGIAHTRRQDPGSPQARTVYECSRASLGRKVIESAEWIEGAAAPRLRISVGERANLAALFRDAGVPGPVARVTGMR